jgi:uncharacterized protein (TIRG00374 family)
MPAPTPPDRPLPDEEAAADDDGRAVAAQGVAAQGVAAQGVAAQGGAVTSVAATGVAATGVGDAGVADAGVADAGVAGSGVGDDVLPPAIRRKGLRRFLPAPVIQIGRVLIVALIVEYLVVPQIAGTRKAFHTLAGVNPLLLLLGAVLEAASIASYTLLTRTVLPPGNDPGFFRLLRIELTTLSVSHCVPGGSAAGSSLGYKLLTAAGVDRTDVGFALATQSLGSAVVLNVIFWIALVVSIPVWGFNPLYLVGAGVGAVLVGGFIALVLAFTRGEQRAGEIIWRIADRLPLVDPDAVRGLFVALATRMRVLGQDRGALARAIGWASANWLLDAASLWVFVGAFGHWVNPDGLLVSYGLANVLAAIPLTPGGLGVVEATLTSTLVGFGTTRAVALLGVVAYRLFNFWAPIPIGGAAYLSLHVDPSPGVAAHRWARFQRWVRGLGLSRRAGRTDPRRT